MQRRAFLRSLLTGAAGLAAVAAVPVDPEQLLWTSGRRTYFDLGDVRLGQSLDQWTTQFLRECLAAQRAVNRHYSAILDSSIVVYDTAFFEWTHGDVRGSRATVTAREPMQASTARALQGVVNHILREGV